MAKLKHAKKWQEIYDEMDGDRRFFALSLVKAIEEIDGLMGEKAALTAQVERLKAPVSDNCTFLFSDFGGLLCELKEHHKGRHRLKVAHNTRVYAARVAVPAEACEYCGPRCQHGAEHNARVEAEKEQNL